MQYKRRLIMTQSFDPKGTDYHYEVIILHKFLICSIINLKKYIINQFLSGKFEITVNE